MGSVPDCCGEERAVTEGKALNLPVNPCFSPHPRLWAECSRENDNGFPLKAGWAQPQRERVRSSAKGAGRSRSGLTCPTKRRTRGKPRNPCRDYIFHPAWEHLGFCRRSQKALLRRSTSGKPCLVCFQCNVDEWKKTAKTGGVLFSYRLELSVPGVVISYQDAANVFNTEKSTCGLTTSFPRTVNPWMTASWMLVPGAGMPFRASGSCFFPWAMLCVRKLILTATQPMLSLIFLRQERYKPLL